MKLFAAFILALVFGCAGMRGAEDAAKPAVGPFALVPPAVAGRLRELGGSKEGLAIIKLADAGLVQAPRAVERVHTEGTLPHQGIWDLSMEAKKDWPLMLDLGLAFRLTGEKRYLDAEDRFLNAWLDVYKVSFNPIDETNMDQVITAYDLAASGLPQATRDKMNGFLREMATGYLERIDKQMADHKEDNANWQSHRIKLTVLAAYALGDEALIGRAEKAFRRQVSVNIAADGTVVDFAKRDALHYVTYDLEPLTVVAVAAREHGHNWFHGPAGAPSVAIAVDWLMPFALGQQTHEEFVHSKVGFDAQRAQAGVKGFAGLWDPSHSIYLFQLAAVLDPKYQTVPAKIVQKSGGSLKEELGLLVKAGL
ncbi:MAG: alginate lyase family protein [Chthoniobacteraceae bacterium]